MASSDTCGNSCVEEIKEKIKVLAYDFLCERTYPYALHFNFIAERIGHADFAQLTLKVLEELCEEGLVSRALWPSPRYWANTPVEIVEFKKQAR